MTCKHDLTQRKVAVVADGLCPLCLREALSEAQDENFVRVPRHPTPTMIKAAADAWDGRTQGRFYDVWKAMLDAAKGEG
jgi:hypothetical protein